MRTAKIVKAVNWQYAFGEVLLIVVGILVALAISDWYERRIDRQHEVALLAEVRTALVTDVSALEFKLEETQLAVAQMENLLGLLDQPPAYNPELDRLFGSVYGIRRANLSSAAYETLKSVGLQTISNDDLRAVIAGVFDYHYHRLATEHEIEQEITLTVMRPYYLRHFVDLAFWENATPVDFQGVIEDPYFHNILHYRVEALKSNQLESYPAAIVDMKTAISQIDAEISK